MSLEVCCSFLLILITGHGRIKREALRSALPPFTLPLSSLPSLPRLVWNSEHSSGLSFPGGRIKGMCNHTWLRGVFSKLIFPLTSVVE